MAFTGFSKSDFNAFQIAGLSERMTAIQQTIQPKFQALGMDLTTDLSAELGQEMFLHIAKHARRKVHPPNDTWLAISSNKRGYKQQPHFQVGLFDDHLFVWLAFIYELPRKKELASLFLQEADEIKKQVPPEYVVSLDHMKKTAVSFSELNLQLALERFRDVKKAEFLIGQHVPASDPLVQDGEKLFLFIKETFHRLIPLYKLSIE